MPLGTSVFTFPCGRVSAFPPGRPGRRTAHPRHKGSYKFTEEPRREVNIWLLLGRFQRMLSIRPDSTHGWVIWPSPSSSGAWDLLIPAPYSVIWASAMINAFCSETDTSQIIAYRCSGTFMWETQMRLRPSDSGATEDRKPRPGSRRALDGRLFPSRVHERM